MKRKMEEDRQEDDLKKEKEEEEKVDDNDDGKCSYHDNQDKVDADEKMDDDFNC